MKTVLITGVGSGIGRALTEKFLKEGYVVIGTYRSNPPDFTHDSFVVYQLDLSSTESISGCFESLKKSGHTIDILINNAGALFDEDETKVNVEKLRQTLEVNLIGTIDFTERILASIHAGGHIVNISSTAGSLDLTGKGASHEPGHYPAYKISKAALNMYTRTLALRLKKEKIAVSSVHPGWVRTDMGGPEADISPNEAAKDIFNFAITHPETGRFWHAGSQIPW